MYKFYNANSRGNFTNDCVVRAISVAENKTWNEVHKELSDLAREQGILLDDVVFVEHYLDSKYNRVCEYSKTVGEFINEYTHGTYLITMAGHITVVVNGILYDVFDPRDKRMWCAWCVKLKKN